MGHHAAHRRTAAREFGGNLGQARIIGPQPGAMAVRVDFDQHPE